MAAVFLQFDALTSRWVVNPDTLAHTAWMRTFSDAELFPADPIIDYARGYQGLGGSLVYRLAAPFLDPVHVGKLLPLLLFAIGGAIVFRLGREMSGSASGGLLAAAWWACTPLVLHKMAGGHSRAWALPLLAFFLDALHHRSAVRLGFSTLLGGILYPITVPLMAGTMTLGCWRRSPESRLGWRLRLPPKVLAAACLGLGLGAGWNLAERSVSSTNPMLDRLGDVTVAERPELGRRGYYPILPTPSLLEEAAEILRQASAPLPPTLLRHGWSERDRLSTFSLSLLVVFTCGVVWGGRNRALPPELIALCTSGALWYLVARAVMLDLFLPERYLRYSWLLAVPLVGALITHRALSGRRPPHRLLATAALLLLMIWNLPTARGLGFRDHSEKALLFEHLEATPRDTLIAAHPYLADSIPLFARRSVFIDFQNSRPFESGWWNWVRRRNVALLEAYYARDLDDVCSFLDLWGVDRLVVDSLHFDPGHLRKGKAVYFEPFRSRIAELTAEGGPFALQDLPSNSTLFSHRSLSVVSSISLGCRPPGS